MTDFHCPACRRFIGNGEGDGRVKLQCKACGRWVVVNLRPEAVSRAVGVAIRGSKS